MSRARNKLAMEKGLQAIYLNTKGEVPSLDRMERVEGRWKRWVLGGVGACLLLSALAWLGFWVVNGRSVPTAAPLALAIQGAKHVSLGEEQAYEIVWKNREFQVLNDVEVRLNAPLDFTVTSLDPVPTDSRLRIWKLGFIQPGSEGRIRVKGFFVGSLGGQTALQSLATYQTNRTEKSLEATALQTVDYQGTVLAGNLLFPARIVAGEPLEVKYVVANLGKQRMNDLAVRILFPAGFVPSSPNIGRVDLVERQALFNVKELAPNTFYTASLRGSFASGMSGDVTFQAETGRMGIDNAFLTAARSESRVAIAPGDLILRLVANGSDVGRSIEPGEPIRAAISYENVSGEVMKDVRIRLQAESIVNGKSATGTSLLDWKAFDDPQQGVSTTKARIQTVTYDKTRLSAFAELSTQGKGSLEVRWPTLAVASGTKDAVIRLVAEAQMSIPGEKAPRTIRSQPIQFTYRTDASLEVEPRYFTEEGAPIGLGPLPPVVGKITTYRVYWRIRKTLHDLKDTKIVATLPKIVAWTGKNEVPFGAMKYDEATRTVAWDIGSVLEGAKEVEGWFEVALTPEKVDAGRFATLLGETSLQAQDGRLLEAITKVKPGLSTDLSGDEGARGKGVVRKE